MTIVFPDSTAYFLSEQINSKAVELSNPEVGSFSIEENNSELLDSVKQLTVTLQTSIKTEVVGVVKPQRNDNKNNSSYTVIQYL